MLPNPHTSHLLLEMNVYALDARVCRRVMMTMMMRRRRRGVGRQQ
jgi:hypothetical protein